MTTRLTGQLTGQATTDPYPTRLSPAVEQPRGEPIVWPDVCDGPLNKVQLEDYERDGFTVCEGLLNRGKLDVLRTEIARLCADPALQADERVITDASTGDRRSIFELHELSALFAELIRDAHLVGCARQILGSEVYVHQSRVNLKPGFGAAGSYWHSDFETWHAEDGMPAMRALSLAISLTENLPYNGPLMIMPGSHRVFVGCEGETPAEHFRSSLRKQEVGTPSAASLASLAERFGIRQLTGPAGSATVFDSNCMHGSSDNITPYPRWNLFVVFNSTENHVREPYRATSRRPEFVCSRNFAPVRSGRRFMSDA